MNYRIAFRETKTGKVKSLVVSEADLMGMINVRDCAEALGEALPAVLYTSTLAKRDRL